MDNDVSQFALTLIVASLSALVAIAINWITGRVSQAKLEQRVDDKLNEIEKQFVGIEKKFGPVEIQLDKIWSWKDFHLRESQDIRQKFYEQIGELKGELAKRDGQYEAITAQLRRIEDQLTKLQKKD